jgi:hypothetical protein
MTIASGSDSGQRSGSPAAPADDDDVIEVHMAGDIAPWVMVPQWLLFAVSGNAVKVYALLLGHVNGARGDRMAYPTREQLRHAFPGLKQARTITTYIAELVEAGALDVVQTYSSAGMRSRNRYILRHNPPDAFTGPRSVGEFHQRIKNDVPAGRPVVRSNAPRREQGGKRVSAGRPVVRSNAPRSAFKRTPVVRSNAPQLEEQTTRTTPPPARAASHSDTAVAEAENGGGDLREDHDTLTAAVLAVRPGWTAEEIRSALALDAVQARPAAQRGPALLALAADPATMHPNRLAVDGPWWQAAAVAARPALPPRCDDLRHDPHNLANRLLDLGDSFAPCPKCHASAINTPTGDQR